MKKGEIFQEIRKSKGISLKQASFGVVSESFLSKFERGKSDISLSNFYSLLKKVNLSMNEFNIICGEIDLVFPFKELLNSINNAYQRRDLELLKEIKLKQLNQWKASGDISFKCNSIMIDSLIKNLDFHYKVKDEDVNFLKDFLFARDYWGYYEMMLFGNSLDIFNFELIKAFVKELINQNTILIDSQYKKEKINILLNIVSLYIENNRIEDAVIYIKKVDELLTNEVFMLQNCVNKFYTGLILIKNRNQIEGENICRDMIEIMNKLGYKDLYHNYSNFLRKVLE